MASHRIRRLLVLSFLLLVVGGASGLSGAGSAAAGSLPGFTQVSVGSDDTCGVTAGGAVMCWGSNRSGQLGIGTTSAGSTVPVAVNGLSGGATQVAVGGEHACAIVGSSVKTDVGVQCWGSNGGGQLGNGTTDDSATPVGVPGTSGATAITAGGAHTCAVFGGGTVKCWGSNAHGQLGDGTTVDSATPVAVTGLGPGVSQIDAGGAHTCAITVGGANCWGSNWAGQLGDGTFTDSPTPTAVGDVSGAESISAGNDHTCVVTGARGAKCWGKNYEGQLGDGKSGILEPTPTAVRGLSSVEQVAAAEGHTCALMSSGGVKCWGANWAGQLGGGYWGYGSDVPVDVVGLDSGVDSVATGTGHHTCALAGGGVACWGLNSSGELGDGTAQWRNEPVGLAARPKLQYIAITVPARTKPGASFTVVAVAQDGLRQRLEGYNASATWTDNSGQLTPDAPADFVDGTSTTTASVSVEAHWDHIEITSGGIIGFSSPFDVVGPMAKIQVYAWWPITATVPFTVYAYATDAAGSTVTSYNGPATWSSLDGHLSPAAPADFVDGVSTTKATVSIPYPNDSITVSSGGFSGTGTFYVYAPRIRIQLSHYPTWPPSVGVPFTVVAAVRNAHGDIIRSWNAPATWSDLSGTLAPSKPPDFVNGVFTTTATISVPQHSDAISVTSKGFTNPSNGFQVIGPMTAINLSFPKPVTAGSPFTLTARAVDAVGNLVNSYNGSATWSDLSGHLSPAAPSSFSYGVSKTTATISSPFHDDRLTFSSGGITRQSSLFNVFP